MIELAKVGWIHIAYALGLVILGYFFAKYLSDLVQRAVNNRFSRHHAMLTRRLVFYGFLLIFIISALQQLGFKMTVLLGAAGVFTVALSFASQTAASNLVSGIFLLFERPFQVADEIMVQNIQGTVESIDLLSTKIRTADNMLIRVPNEVIMKSEITNISYFPQRRIDILVGIDYKSDIEQVKAVMLALANESQYVLQDPPVNISIDKFADFSIQIKLMVWVATKDVTKATAQLHEVIKQRFDQAAIEIPFPKVTLYQG